MIKFSCPKCNCLVFTMVSKNSTTIDFRYEGAVEGHPAVRYLSSKFEYFLCGKCAEKVPTEQADKMFAEVLV